MASRAQYPERSLNGGIEAGFAAANRIVGTRPREGAGPSGSDADRVGQSAE
jgi:hypothetical protein